MQRSTMTKGLGGVALAVVAIVATTGPLATGTSATAGAPPTAGTPSSEDLAKTRAVAMSVSPSHLWRAGGR